MASSYWNFSLTVVNNLLTENLVVSPTILYSAETATSSPTVGSYVTPNMDPPANWTYGASYDAGVYFVAQLQPPQGGVIQISCIIRNGLVSCTSSPAPSGLSISIAPPYVQDGTNASATAVIMPAS